MLNPQAMYLWQPQMEASKVKVLVAASTSRLGTALMNPLPVDLFSLNQVNLRLGKVDPFSSDISLFIILMAITITQQWQMGTSYSPFLVMLFLTHHLFIISLADLGWMTAPPLLGFSAMEALLDVGVGGTIARL